MTEITIETVTQEMMAKIDKAQRPSKGIEEDSQGVRRFLSRQGGKTWIGFRQGDIGEDGSAEFLIFVIRSRTVRGRSRAMKRTKEREYRQANTRAIKMWLPLDDIDFTNVWVGADDIKSHYQYLKEGGGDYELIGRGSIPTDGTYPMDDLLAKFE